MKEEVFKISAQDTGFTKVAKREANIIMASLANLTSEYNEAYDRFSDLIKICQSIDSCEFLYEEQITQLFSDIDSLYKDNVLSPLKLTEDEFNSEGINIRYPDIQKLNSEDIINYNAYRVKICHIYDDDIKSEIVDLPEKFNNIDITRQPNIYLNKGGIITGEVLLHPCIKETDKNHHKFVVRNPIEIPCSIIFTSKDPITGEQLRKKDGYVVVDHRHPSLKELTSNYDVDLCFSEAVKKLKFNVRNYRKLGE